MDAYRTALGCLPDMGTHTLARLLQLCGGPRQAWHTLERGGARAAALVGAERCERWKEFCRCHIPARMHEELKQRGIWTMAPGDGDYPEVLCSIYDPPALLFAMGKRPPQQSPYVAVVGSRKASSYGRWASETLGSELARQGVVVVSGAAYGIDGHAHLGCLKAEGFTIAVLGCGVEQVYPRGHERLLASIAESGCVISEYPPDSGPLPWRFPHRNRIIAGLSHAVVVVEASRRSGALITADMALEEGREVMAVPGPITSPLAEGTNALIQKGAKLVTTAWDICEELPYLFQPGGRAEGPSPGGEGRPAAVEIGEGEGEILEFLQGGAKGLDWLAAMTGKTSAELLSTLTVMSLRGWVGEEAGGRYCLLDSPLRREKPVSSQ